MQTKNILLLLLVLVLIWPNITVAATPNISIMERDRKGELIFIYEYYGFYDSSSQQLKKRSYLEIISTIKGSLYVQENSPLFTHLAWFSEKNILVALSTITTRNNPQIVIYAPTGKELGRKTITCNKGYTQSGAKCYQHKQNLYWFDKENDPELYVKVDVLNKSDISVCLAEYCYKLN